MAADPAMVDAGADASLAASVEAWLGVAHRLCLQGNAAAAAGFLEERVAEHPDSACLRATLGHVDFELGRYAAALDCFERVLEELPGHPGGRQGLAFCLSRRPWLALRLRSPGLVLDGLGAEGVDPELLSRAAAVLLRASPAPLEDPLLAALLCQALVTDLDLEQGLTRLRREMCLAPPEEEPALAAALAEQCRLNEFAWVVSAEESARLGEAPGWVRAMYGPEGIDPALVERGARIPTLSPIAAGNSAAVQGMYEQNPYPLWRRISYGSPEDLDEHLRWLTYGAWEPPAFLARPRILVAGCGTGRDLLWAAGAWRPAAITGVDLSRTSLAYAQRMAQAMGVEAELYHADLLELGDWDREFDAIVCTGVLHHLEDPLGGWRRLLRLLRPGGVMLVGLYSEIARRGIVAAQDQVRELGLPPTPAGIRTARGHIASLPAEAPAREATWLRDFFHASGCRDLLCHVQEHRFTVADLVAALEDLSLDFLAFEIDGAVRHRHRTLFGPQAGLATWGAFEEFHPHTFLGMYQLWCQAHGE